VLSDRNINKIIDSYAKELSEAQIRNFDKWIILGKCVWPNPKPYPETYEEEIKRLKHWLNYRCKWIDENIDLLLK